MMPEGGLDKIRKHDAIFLGAVGFPGVPDHVSLWGLLIPIRRDFNQYVNLRPCRVLRGMTSPLAGRGPDDIDFFVVRENVEGEYSEIGGRMFRGTEHEAAMQESIFTRRGTDRVMRYAFELARAAAEEARHLGHQVERHRPHHAVLGRALRGDEGELSGHPRRPVPYRHSRRAFRAASGLVRRGGRLEPVRRHPVRPRPGGRRLDRHRAIGQYQSGARIPLDVRAGAWLGARHRRQGHRQSDRADLVGRDDAGTSRPQGRRRRRDRGDRGGARRSESAHPRPRRNRKHG